MFFYSESCHIFVTTNKEFTHTFFSHTKFTHIMNIIMQTEKGLRWDEKFQIHQHKGTAIVLENEIQIMTETYCIIIERIEPNYQ